MDAAPLGVRGVAGGGGGGSIGEGNAGRRMARVEEPRKARGDGSKCTTR